MKACLIALSLLSLGASPDVQTTEPTEHELLTVTPAQSAAVESGLAWLASAQNSDGSWTAKIGYKLHDGYDYLSANRGHVGVTALAGLAFLAGGHLPGRGEYGDNIERCLDFVLSCADDDGYVNRSRTRMYSHAFATLFLAEVYGMTAREDVKSTLQRSVDFIVEAQNVEGGWRYEPFEVESDMSIVVCQVLALRAARNIGIRVPKATVDNAARYVVDSSITRGKASGLSGPFFMGGEAVVGSFKYQKDGPSRSSFPLTAAGVTALHGLGIYSDEALKLGYEYLVRELPEFNARYGETGRKSQRGHYFFWYGHYYGVQAMYQAGDPYWQPYFREVRDVIIGMQQEDGSFPNGTGPGDAFGTAMGVLVLEIPYRFLPIFQR